MPTPTNSTQKLPWSVLRVFGQKKILSISKKNQNRKKHVFLVPYT
jgi:hypothetical protein